jgi:putative membrane protein
MSAAENLTDLTKYMVTLPETHISVFIIVFLSFITGLIAFLIEPQADSNILSNIVYGGSAGFLIFGLMSIMAGAITPTLLRVVEGRRMKMKQSMFLALLAMIIVAIIYVLGSLVSHFSIYNYTIDSVIYGCAIVFAFRTIVIWGTSNIRLLASVVVASTQPALILSMVMVIVFLTSITTNLGEFNIIAVLFKIIIASIILVLAIFSFVVVIESPMRKNLGVGGLELLSLFISHLSEGSQAMESIFDDMGESITTLVGILSFKGENGLKAIFLSPCVHPGPVGDIGGGNMPTTLANRFDAFTMVSHGPSTHDFNPVASKEIVKIENVIKDSLNDMDYSEYASEFQRVKYQGAKIGTQFFGNNLVLLATFSPKGFDDIDFGVGLAVMNAAKGSTCSDNVLMVDCHNSFKGDGGRILPGNKEVFELLGAVEKLGKNEDKQVIRLGCSSDPLDDMSKEQGVGQSGVKVMVVEVGGNQKTAYILLDANNMVIGFREKIIKSVKSLGLDCGEVMTTDTHYVNTLSGGHNPVGVKMQDEIINAIIKCTKNAIDDLEPVKAGVKVAEIDDIKTLGPTHATELVTTISSIVAVSKVFAPLVFVLALVFAFIWIFYGAG